MKRFNLQLWVKSMKHGQYIFPTGNDFGKITQYINSNNKRQRILIIRKFPFVTIKNNPCLVTMFILKAYYLFWSVFRWMLITNLFLLRQMSYSIQSFNYYYLGISHICLFVFGLWVCLILFFPQIQNNKTHDIESIYKISFVIGVCRKIQIMNYELWILNIIKNNIGNI